MTEADDLRFAQMEANSTIPRRLYKSRRNRMIDGICGGVAEYFDIDPTIVRIVWVLVTLLGGSGLFLYIAAMIIMPVNPDEVLAQPANTSPAPQPDRRRFWGITFVLLGAFFLMINLGWLADLNWWSFSRTVMLPSLLIVLGVVLIYTYRHRQPDSGPPDAQRAGAFPPVSLKELRRSVKERKVFGVCGGIANYFNLDPTIVRVIYVLLVLASFGWGLLLYIILAIVMPEEKPSITSA